MKFSKPILAAVLGVALLSGAVVVQTGITQTAYAQTLSAKRIVDQAKTDLQVGEQIDGYLGLIVDNVPENVRAAVNEINIKRKSLYTKTARDKNVSVSDVAGLSGEKQLGRAKPGQKVKGNDDVWRTVGG